MKRRKTGFTLIEVVVVVLIIGILASIGIPYYYKTIETSRASDAVSIGHLIANAHRMYKVDHPTTNLSGTLYNGCNTGACTVNPGPSADICELVRCNYVASQAWDSCSYAFTVSAALAASAQRYNAPSGTVYETWGYNFDLNGGCTPVGAGVPDCPKF